MGLRTGKAKKKIRDLARKVYKELYPSEKFTVNFLPNKDMPYAMARAEISDMFNQPSITFNLKYIYRNDYKYSIIHEIAHIIHLRGLGYDKMTHEETLLICFDYHNPNWREIYHELGSKFGLRFSRVQREGNRCRRLETDMSGKEDTWRARLKGMENSITSNRKYKKAYDKECNMSYKELISYDERVRMGNGGFGCEY